MNGIEYDLLESSALEKPFLVEGGYAGERFRQELLPYMGDEQQPEITAMSEPEDDNRIYDELAKLREAICDDVRENGFWRASTLWATLGALALAAGALCGIFGIIGLVKGPGADQVFFFWMAAPLFIAVALGVLAGALVLFLYLVAGLLELISVIPTWVWLILVLVLIFR